MTDQTKLYDLDSERIILSSLINDISNIDIVRPEFFYSMRLRRFYDAIRAIFDSGDTPTEQSIKNWMVRNESWKEVGDIDELINLSKYSSAGFDVNAYVDIIKDLWQRRSLQAIAKELYESSQGIETIEQITEGLSKKINNIKLDKCEESELYWDLFMTNMESLENGSKTKPSGFKSGLDDLDALINFFALGQVDIIGARPAMGKTSLALNLALSSAVTEDIPTLIISVELDRRELSTQLSSIQSSIPIETLDKATNGRSELDSDNWDKLYSISDTVKKLPIWIDDKSMTADKVISSIKYNIEKHGIQSVIIDYIQLIKMAEKRGVNSAKIIGDFATEIARIAKEFNIHVFFICQLNRMLESRADKRPIPSDLKDSGDLEQIAYRILLIYQDQIYNPNSDDRGIAEIILAKNRRGARGVVRVAFNGECTQFKNLNKW